MYLHIRVRTCTHWSQDYEGTNSGENQQPCALGTISQSRQNRSRQPCRLALPKLTSGQFGSHPSHSASQPGGTNSSPALGPPGPIPDPGTLPTQPLAFFYYPGPFKLDSGPWPSLGHMLASQTTSRVHTFQQWPSLLSSRPTWPNRSCYATPKPPL